MAALVDADGFIVVRRGSRGWRSSSSTVSPGDRARATAPPTDIQPDHVDIDAITDRVKGMAECLSTSHYYHSLLEKLAIARRLTSFLTDHNDHHHQLQQQLQQLPPLQLLCYGLGHVTTSRISQWQLALLLLLRNHLQQQQQPLHHQQQQQPHQQQQQQQQQPSSSSAPVCCEVFDPCFWPSDRQLLHQLQLPVVSHDEQCRRHLASHTLVYMPHCDSQLYEQLLAANWLSPRQLPRCLVLGNSFERRRLVTPARQLSSWWPRLDRACTCRLVHEQPAVVEPIDTSHVMSEAFNDTALHCFPVQRCLDAPASVWTWTV